MQGYCCAPRCWNLPHSWQLGWVSVQQLDGSRLKPGQTVSTRLPSQSATAAGAGLRIVPDWVPRWDDPQAGTAPLFVGFRTKQGGDVQLFDGYAGKANVYTAAIANARDTAGSVLEASLAGELCLCCNSTATLMQAGQASLMRAALQHCSWECVRSRPMAGSVRNWGTTLCTSFSLEGVPAAMPPTDPRFPCSPLCCRSQPDVDLCCRQPGCADAWRGGSRRAGDRLPQGRG